MARVVTSIHIAGAVERVFDVVTTPRHWPGWHPATTAVGGVTERPVALGDVVRERAQIGGREHEGAWTVVEHERPTRVVLRIEGDRLTIAYRFTPEGTATVFTRELTYQPEDFLFAGGDAAAVERLMEQQSAAALAKLKPLVEAELASDPG